MTQRAYQRRANQKLAFSRWHLEWARDLPAQAQQRLALLESALWHGAAAYRCFLAEIATDEHLLPNAAEQYHDAITLAAAYSDYSPAAVRECANLEADRSSWLSSLLQGAQAAARLGDEAPAPVSANLISSSGRESPIPDCATLGEYLAELEQLVERLRGDMLEY